MNFNSLSITTVEEFVPDNFMPAVQCSRDLDTAMFQHKGKEEGTGQYAGSVEATDNARGISAAVRRLVQSIATGLLVASLAPEAEGRTVMQIESSYLGNGLFRCKVDSFPVPNTNTVSLNTLGISQIIRHETNSVPANWVCNVTASGSVSFARLTPSFDAPPASQTFYVKTGVSNYIVVPTGAFAYLNVERTDGTTGNGYHIFGVVGASPFAGDPSTPTNMVSRWEVPCDVEMGKLAITNGQVYGLSMNANADLTVKIEGSFDLRNWTNEVATIQVTNGLNNWTTSQPISQKGNFFRVEIVK